MSGFFHAILSIIVAVFIHGGVSGVVDVAPQEAVDDFMAGLTSGDKQAMEQYMDNEYVNFLVNTEGDEKVLARMNDALFENLEYTINDTAEKGNVAVVEVELKTNDFSDVMKKYDKDSYEFVMDHLYDDKVTDKKKLNAECLNIYVEEIEKDAGKDASIEKEIYIPMVGDGYGGWKILLDDKLMKSFLGELAMPE
ncbi:MAG: DUF5105 domain-containing protein [Bacillota bacterium]|nr:DUF5105 domain-containing protein [Bacillota bacterium]